jgi:Ca2+-binding RTX toxin-like protein
MGTFTGGGSRRNHHACLRVRHGPSRRRTAPLERRRHDLGGAGDDTIDGGKGDDFIDGGLGADLISGGDGADTIRWSPGSNSDVIDGGKGFDTLQFNTANIGEDHQRAGLRRPRRRHPRHRRDHLDLTDVERITFGSAGGGADHFFIAGLGGTQVRQVDIDLATPDSLVDTVLVNGEAGADHIVLTGGAGSVSVAGLPATVQVSNGEAIDRAIIAGLDGDDTLDASALGGGMVVNFDGGMGEDVLAFKTGGADDAIVLASSSPTVEGQPIFADINGAVSQVNVTDVATTTLDTGGGADSIRASAYNAPANLVINAGDVRTR